MTHFIFASEEEAFSVSTAILRLGSLALHIQRGLALRPDGVVAEGISNGQPVPIDLAPLWDVPRQCAEGWAITSPEGWGVSPGQNLWTTPLTAPLSVIAASLGLPAPEADVEITMTGAEWVALALDGVPYSVGGPTFPDLEA